MNNKGNHFSYFLLLAFVFVFIFFIIFISLRVKPCSDDLWFYYNYVHEGWFNSIYNFKYNQRWVSFLTYNSICFFSRDFNGLKYIFTIYYFIIFSLLFYSTFRLFKITIDHFFNIKMSNIETFILSTLFISSFYFSSLHSQEVWFWTIGNTTYLLPIPLLFIAIYEFFKSDSLKSNTIIFSMFFLIGGTLENLISTILMCLTIFLIYSLNTKYRIQIKKTLIAIGSIIVLPILSFKLTSVNNRIILNKSNLPTTKKIDYFDKLFLDYNVKINIPRIAIFIIILFMIYYIATKVKSNIESHNLSIKKTLKINAVLIILVALSTYLPLIYIFGNLGPARASIPFELFLCLSIIMWVFMLGLKNSSKHKIFHTINNTFGVITLTLFSYKHYFSSKQFAFAFDERINYISTQKDTNSDYIVVSPLPNPGVLASQEVNKINGKYTNTSYYLGRVLGINKNVYLK